MGRAGVQTQELSTGMVGTSHNGRSRCADLELSAQGWWEPLIMGTAGVQTQEFSTGMVGTPPNGQSRCTDPGTQHRDGGNFS
ncbi:unnamed protein product [Staurois parvus]|uniref:Uncharacterized protein n=2 Tax=Staurois parvus TaxID=386267 RepID=A0ABN9F9E1_9NEOB|nr:unnamed protein product [Staurois parvus]